MFASHPSLSLFQSSSCEQSGLGQYGVVQMIKHDIIPKHFKHRYLLSDFGLVQLDPLEGTDPLLSLSSSPSPDMSHLSLREKGCSPCRYSHLLLEA
jgi:hypothetical protein